MVCRFRWVRAAKKLLDAAEPHQIYCFMGTSGLDLSVEALVLAPDYFPLFTEEDGKLLDPVLLNMDIKHNTFVKFGDVVHLNDDRSI